MDKQLAGFKFGKYRTGVLESYGEIHHNDRTYRLVLLKTSDSMEYFSIRLYHKEHFIKQLLFEPQIVKDLADLLYKVERR